jgi:pantoate--beta-alanine ligase
MTVVVTTRAELAGARAGLAGPLVLVPTMGALHEGHRSLFRKAREVLERRERGGSVVVSIFVNPLQFGPDEDLDRYPRPLEQDLRICEEEGVSLVFAPTPEIMYPVPAEVTVGAGRMGTIVEGACRPGHFDGVLTVVMKLFNLTRPDIAVFGEKDAQQLAVIRRMVHDLDLGIQIVAAPTVREPDGLALSSRNRYLSAPERATALALYRALRAGAEAATPAGAVKAAKAVLEEAVASDPPLQLDYLVLVDPATFAEVPEDYAGTAVLAVAGKVGATHLIDNVRRSYPPAG